MKYYNEIALIQAGFPLKTYHAANHNHEKLKPLKQMSSEAADIHLNIITIKPGSMLK